MSTTNFTPGPWYSTGAHIQSAVLNEDNYVCEAEGNTPEQVEANARLIAAAPELFEACKAIEKLDGEANTTEMPDFRSFLAVASEIARAALAKAMKGENDK